MPAPAGSANCQSFICPGPEPFETVDYLRALLGLVRELTHEERERLQVSRDSQRPSVHRIETHVADKRRRNFFRTLVLTAVNQARSVGLAPGLEDAEQKTTSCPARAKSVPS